jgi:AcrR family transcriptional regulator
VAADTRARILDGAADALVRFGLAKTTVEDVANAAGVGRATVYRWFPDGRDGVFDALVARELGSVADEILGRLTAGPDLATGLHAVLRWGGPALRSHTLLQAALDSAPDELAVRLARFEDGLDDLLVPVVAERLVAEAGEDPGRERDAQYVVTMVLSLMANPGSWDLDDDAEVAELVRTQVLAGVEGLGTVA